MDANPWTWESIIRTGAGPSPWVPVAASHRVGWYVGGRAQVAPRDGDEDPARGGDRSQELAMGDGSPLGGSGEAGDVPLVVAEQRVDGRRRREQTLHRPEDDDQVDVETSRSGEEADVDAVADRAAASRRDVELGHERRPELGAVDGRADRVEVAQPVEDPLGALVGLLLVVTEPGERRRAEPGFELLVGPADPFVPSARRPAVAEAVAEVADEGEQGLAGVGVAGSPLAGVGDVRRQPGVPVLVAHDPGPAPDALPPGSRHAPAVGAAGGDVAEQGHQVGAPQAAAVEVEQLGQHAGHRPLARAGARSPVPRDLGGGEMVLDEPGIRDGRRATAPPSGRTAPRRGRRRGSRARPPAPRRRRPWSRPRR